MLCPWLEMPEDLFLHPPQHHGAVPGRGNNSSDSAVTSRQP